MTQEAKNDLIPYPSRFPLGQIVATPGVLEACNPQHMITCLSRHARGDWGNVCADDKTLNDQALIDGERVLSAYAIDRPALPCQRPRSGLG